VAAPQKKLSGKTASTFVIFTLKILIDAFETKPLKDEPPGDG